MKKYILCGPLGRLAKWLRLLGFDVLYYREFPKDLLEVAAAEDRIVVLKGGKHCFSGAVSIKSDSLEEQILEFISRTGETLREGLFFTRCSLCNGLLEEISRKEAVDKGVPDYVLFSHDKFSYCPDCDRAYWPGTHRKNFLEKIRDISLRMEGNG